MAQMTKINLAGLDPEHCENEYKMFAIETVVLQPLEVVEVDFNYDIKLNSDKIRLFAESLIEGLLVKKVLDNHTVRMINITDKAITIKEKTLFLQLFITLPIKTKLVLEVYDIPVVEVPKDAEIWFIRNYVNNKMLSDMHGKLNPIQSSNKYVEAEQVYRKLPKHYKDLYQNRFNFAVKTILSL